MNAPQAEVDIIIPVLSEFPMLLRVLDSLPKAFPNIPYKVIMVDDASPTSLEQFMAGGPDEPSHNQTNYRILKNTTRMGFPTSCNKGTAIGMAPYVLYLNSDCILFENCGKILLEAMKQDKSIGIIAPMLIFPPDSKLQGRPPNKIQHAGIMFDVFGNPVHAFVSWSPTNVKAATRREMQAVTGACMMTTRDIIKQIGSALHKNDRNHQFGMFQQDYGWGTYEDVEACFTVRALGKKVIFEPTAQGIHYVGTSAIASNTGFPLHRNEMIFRARWSDKILWDEYKFV